MSVAHFLIHRVDVRAPTKARTASGGTTSTFNVTTPNMRCRVVVVKVLERALSNKLEAEITHKVFCFPHEKIQENYELAFGTRTLEVMTVEPPTPNLHFQVLHVRERRE